MNEIIGKSTKVQISDVPQSRIVGEQVTVNVGRGGQVAINTDGGEKHRTAHDFNDCSFAYATATPREKGVIIRVGTVNPTHGWIFMNARVGIEIRPDKSVLYGGYTEVELAEVVKEHGPGAVLHSFFRMGEPLRGVET